MAGTWSRWLRKWLGLGTSPAGGGARRARAGRAPRLEGLEDRTVPSGDLNFAFKIGGPLPDEGRSMLRDSAGNLYVAGYFSGTVDFDPGAGSFTLSAFGSTTDIFVAKYSSTGSFIWAAAAGGTGEDKALAMTRDAD